MAYSAMAIRQFGRLSFGSLDDFHSAVWTIPVRQFGRPHLQYRACPRFACSRGRSAGCADGACRGRGCGMPAPQGAVPRCAPAKGGVPADCGGSRSGQSSAPRKAPSSYPYYNTRTPGCGFAHLLRRVHVGASCEHSASPSFGRRRRFSGPCLVPFVEGLGGISETTKDIGVDFAPWAKKLCQKAEESFNGLKCESATD